MKKEKILITASISGFSAVAAILLYPRIAVSPDGLAGFATVAMLLAIAALEYRLSPSPRSARTATVKRVQSPSLCTAATRQDGDRLAATGAYARSSRLPKRSLSGLVALR
jgi:hypothetical protein